MAIASLSNLRRDISKIEFSGLSLPFLVLLIILMLILPLPVFMLGFLFTFNIVVGLVIIMIAINSTKPLDFSSLPSILLLATMLRLGLNVASTRLVLVKDHKGSTPQVTWSRPSANLWLQAQAPKQLDVLMEQAPSSNAKLIIEANFNRLWLADEGRVARDCFIADPII